MKKNVIAVMLSMMMAVGSVGGSSVFAAETTAQGASEIAQEEEMADPEVSEEDEDASSGAIEEDVSEAEPAQVVEEESEEVPIQEIETSDEIIDSIDTEITSMEENELLEEPDSSADVLMEEENQNVEEEEIIEDEISDLMEESRSADAQASVSNTAVVSFAAQYEGYPYAWGTHGPNSFDCSGFVYYVFNHFGIGLSCSSSDYWSNPGSFGTVVSESAALPGDIVSWNGHVGIYTGDGYCINALNSSVGVVYLKITSYINANGTSNPPHKYIRVNGVSYSGDTPPKNPTITVSKSYYLPTETIRIQANADGATSYYGAIYRQDTRIWEGYSQAGGVIEYPASQYGEGEYSAYVTCINNAGWVDTKWVSYTVNGSKPKNPTITVSKSHYLPADTIRIQANADGATSYYGAIYRQDTRIWEGYSQDGGIIEYPASQYGQGEYSAYVTCSNNAGWVDTKWVSYFVDGTPPVISNVQITDITKDGYTITCDVSDNIGVTRAAYSVFNRGGFSNRKKQGTVSNGKATFMVDIRDVLFVTDGEYTTVIYVYDAAGNSELQWIEVDVIPLTGIQLPSAKTVEYGKTLTCQMTYEPDNTTDDKTATWSSGNTSIFTVSNEGVVTPTGIGTATLTAKVGNLTATSQVTVKKGTPKYSKPGAVNAACGQKLSEIKLPAGFKWNTADQSVGSAGTNTYTATFTPDDTAHYNTVGNISVTVNVSHAYADKWTAGTDTHWHECACGTKADEASHTYGSWKVTKEPTCTAKGSRQRSCMVCGKKVTEAIAAKGHTWNKDYTIDKEPTFTEEGSKSIHCAVCDAVKDGSGVSIQKLTKQLGKTTRGDMFNLANNVKVTWKEVPGAKYYKVYREGITDKKETQKEPVIVTERLVGWDSQPGLTNGHAYRYKIVASLTGKGDSSGDSPLSYSKVMYRLKTVVIRSVKNTAPGKVTVKYDKTTSGDSYVLQYCEREDMIGAKTKVVLGANNTSYTIGGLKKGKTYYISIRVRKKVDGIDYYTTFGVPKKIKIEK